MPSVKRIMHNAKYSRAKMQHALKTICRTRHEKHNRLHAKYNMHKAQYRIKKNAKSRMHNTRCKGANETYKPHNATCVSVLVCVAVSVCVCVCVCVCRCCYINVIHLT